jgi:hypothetical protein
MPWPNAFHDHFPHIAGKVGSEEDFSKLLNIEGIINRKCGDAFANTRH